MLKDSTNRPLLLPARFLAILLPVLIGIVPKPAFAGGKAGHAVIMVWDGLRPDMVSEANTPTLHRLAKEGTFFGRHHAVFPSTTEVNGTALATGMYPANSGIVGNREYRPDINPSEPVATEAVTTVRPADESTGGKYLAVPTIHEIVQSAGYPTVVAGTKPVALLPDRSAERAGGAAAKSATVFEGKTLPESLRKELEDEFGKFLEQPSFPDRARNTWTVDVLVKRLWKDRVPKLSLLWMSDPDFSQHSTQPGSPEALAALKANDDLLARVLKTLEEKGVRDDTDLFVVSDHGFSSVEKTEDLVALLTKAGFRAVRKFPSEPKPGDILVVGNGGAVFFYVTGREKETIRRLAEFLRACEICGVVFTPDAQPGTFAMKAAHINSPAAPDVVVSLNWSSGKNASGVKGLLSIDATGILKPGLGTHGSLSPFDMHNTLIANGPDFRQGLVSELPSGNVDVAPTVLWVLGISPPHKMDGRILSEALRNPPAPAQKPGQKTLTARGKDGRQQYLKISSVGETEYLDEGNNGHP